MPLGVKNRKHGVLTTGPPGNSYLLFLIDNFVVITRVDALGALMLLAHMKKIKALPSTPKKKY